MIDWPSSLRRMTTGLALTSMVVALWALIHRFVGLQRDGELYAFQAMARIHPALNADVYLAFNSQDRYTIFSPLYAFCIAHSSLQSADLGLFLFCTLLYFCAAYFLSRKLFGVTVGWVTIGLLIIIAGHYGAFEVFSYSEDYLTARSLAVALVILSLALHVSCHRVLAGFTVAVAMLVHPIMALPGSLLLVCLNLPIGVCVAGAALSCSAVLGLAIVASVTPILSNYLPLIDPAWLEVVQERSQFLFLNFWRPVDWELTAQPFVSLTLAALVATDARVRKFYVIAMLIGASGLAVALIAGSIGPVAILVQGQAWRWIWLTSFVAVLSIAPTAMSLWRDSRCGPLAAVLLISGWTWNYSGANNLLLMEFALLLWLIRDRLTDRAARVLRWTAWAVVILLAAWIVSDGWNSAPPSSLDPDIDSQVISRIREFLAPGLSAVAVAGCACWLILRTRSAATRGAVLAVLFVAALLVVPGSLKPRAHANGTPQEVAEFAEWRRQIPPNSNVLLVPVPVNAAFAWITLNRPNYMSVDQSSGVVFARATALEIRRRSEILLPIADPDWKIMTRINARKQGRPQAAAPPKKLTAEALIEVCADRQLGFVIAKEELAYAHSHHDQAGTWGNWNLYDCGQIRTPLQGT
jgi:hypothetical protein